MTPKERYLALLSGEQPDLVPRIPILMQFAAEHIGSNYGAFASDHRVLVEANLQCAEQFGFDQVSCISDPYRETAGLGGDIRFRENNTPECVAPPLPDLEKLGDVQIPDPEAAPRMRDRLDAIRLYRHQSVDHFSILGWVEGPAALAGDVHGLMDFLMDLIEEPEASEVLLDLCTETSIRFALAQIEAGADTIGIGDAICSQMSGDTYEELILPREKRLIEAIRSAGAAVRMHICGQTKHLWPGLSQLPIDILDCDHMVDLPAAREAFGNVILAGNHDPVADILHGTPESIRQLTLDCQQSAGSRFVVNAGCEIPSGTPIANLKALCEPLPCG